MVGNAAGAGLQVVRLRPNIGAAIRGADLAAGIAAAQAAVVRAALNEHEVVILRDQQIAADRQMAFARHFGELSIHPFSPNLPHRRTMERVTLKGDPVFGPVDDTIRAAGRSADATRNDGVVVRQFARRNA